MKNTMILCDVCPKLASAVMVLKDVFPGTYRVPETEVLLVNGNVCEHHLTEIINEMTPGEKMTVMHYSEMTELQEVTHGRASTVAPRATAS